VESCRGQRSPKASTGRNGSRKEAALRWIRVLAVLWVTGFLLMVYILRQSQPLAVAMTHTYEVRPRKDKREVDLIFHVQDAARLSAR